MNDHDENIDNESPEPSSQPLPETRVRISPPTPETPAETVLPASQQIREALPLADPPSVADPQPSQVLAGDPMAAAIPAFQAKRILPEDLRVSWSWPHLIVFIFFGFASLMVVQLGFVFYVSANRHLSAVQVQRVFENSPQLLVETNVLWYGLLFLFLYVTLAVLRDVPFWRSLGWRKLSANPSAGTGKGWMYFFSGCGLAIFVALASYNMKDTEHLPIQEIFKNRSGAMLLMAMAVFVAPLVEETVFRGYLYPLFAKSLGVVPGILITGVLFGLMHGSQLGWTFRLVLLLTIVGVIFTFARARTGTVLASFLLHLGYNSMIAVTSIIATKGFQHMPMSP
jgi:membrane protease YdiL (CAAX protease family)